MPRRNWIGRACSWCTRAMSRSTEDRLRAWFVVAALAAVSGCGARSGLEVPPLPDAGFDTPPPPDANVDAPRPDAFSTVVPEITIRVTADNSYRFGFGDATSMRDVGGAAEAFAACEIFCCSTPCSAGCAGSACGPFGLCEDGLGAEIYRIEEGRATAADFVYVVAWSDDAVTQGVLGEIQTRDRIVHSGDDGWSVCATGRNYNTGSGGPPESELNEWLRRCNGGDSPSGGWVGVTSSGPSLAIGETNGGSEGDFPETCIGSSPDSISREARWMWFDRDARAGADPFVEVQPEFLIFRLPTRVLLGR